MRALRSLQSSASGKPSWSASTSVPSPVLSVNVRVAGVGSTLPTGSVAVIVTVWVPASSGGVVNGEEQGAAAAASTAQVRPEPGSLAPNSNVGATSTIVAPSAGPLVMSVSGGVVSTVQVCVLGSPARVTLGGSSVAWKNARTENSWVPSVSPPTAWPVVGQVANAAPS